MDGGQVARGVVGPRGPGARNLRHLPRSAPSPDWPQGAPGSGRHPDGDIGAPACRQLGNGSDPRAPEDGMTVGGHRGSGPQGGTNPALPGWQRAARRGLDGGAHPHAGHHTSGLNSYFTIPINFGN